MHICSLAIHSPILNEHDLNTYMHNTATSNSEHERVAKLYSVWGVQVLRNWGMQWRYEPFFVGECRITENYGRRKWSPIPFEQFI